MTNDKIQKVKVLERALAKIMEGLHIAMEDATHRWHVEDILTQQVDAGKLYGTIAVFLSHRLIDHDAEDRFKNISQHLATLEERVVEIMNVSQCLTKPEAITILEDQVGADIKFADNMEHLYKVYMVADAHFDEMVKTYEGCTGDQATKSLMKYRIHKFAEDFALIMDLLIKASQSTEDIDRFTPHGASTIVHKHRDDWAKFMDSITPKLPIN